MITFSSLYALVAKVFNVVLAVFMIIPMILTMSFDDSNIRDVIENENATNPHITSYGDVDISAHRSGAGIAPQNTLMAFEKVLTENDKLGVDTYEFDVQVTKDGKLIIMHNLTYDATSNAVEEFGRENVYANELTYEEAQVLNMGENFEVDGEYPYRGLRGDDIPYNLHVPLCEDVIDYIEKNSGDKEYKYIIEIKSKGSDGEVAADELQRIIKEHGLIDRAIWASSNQDVSNYMRDTYPEIARSANVLEVLQFYLYARMNWDLTDANVSYVALQIPYGESAANGLINLGTRRVINYAHKYNIAVQYWTVNDAESVEYLAKNGADCIMTDYPDMAHDVLANLELPELRSYAVSAF